MTASLATSHFLFINNGQGQFTDETAARGAQGVLAQPYPGYDPVTFARLAGVAAGDVNRDGWVSAFGCWCIPCIHVPYITVPGNALTVLLYPRGCCANVLVPYFVFVRFVVPRFVDLLVTEWTAADGFSHNQVLLINRGGSEVRDASGAWPPQESMTVEAVLTGSHVVIRAPPWLATL